MLHGMQTPDGCLPPLLPVLIICIAPHSRQLHAREHAVKYYRRVQARMSVQRVSRFYIGRNVAHMQSVPIRRLEGGHRGEVDFGELERVKVRSMFGVCGKDKRHGARGVGGKTGVSVVKREHEPHGEGGRASVLA